MADQLVTIATPDIVSLINEFRNDIEEKSKLDKEAKEKYKKICEELAKGILICQKHCLQKYQKMLEEAKLSAQNVNDTVKYIEERNDEINKDFKKGLKKIYTQWTNVVDALVVMDKILRKRYLVFTVSSIVASVITAGGIILLVLHFTPAVPFVLAIEVLATVLAVTALATTLTTTVGIGAVITKRTKGILKRLKKDNELALKNALAVQQVTEENVDKAIGDFVKDFVSKLANKNTEDLKRAIGDCLHDILLELQECKV